jgi:hypothetical protein
MGKMSVSFQTKITQLAGQDVVFTLWVITWVKRLLPKEECGTFTPAKSRVLARQLLSAEAMLISNF